MVDVSYDRETDCVFANIIGEIDHHGAGAMRDKIDIALEIYKPATLVLNFKDVAFMDSSGIGLVMGRYRQMSTMGGSVIIRGAAGHIKKVMLLSGLQRIVEFID
jgi:stage II sporulation protein AA (anti-sigma F factor antagonist)